MEEYSEFDINTGDIYSDLSLLEDILPRDFFYEYEQKLEDLLYYKPLDNLKLPFNDPYTDEKLYENNFHTEHHKDPGHRPYTWFFLKESRIIDGYELVDFMNQYIVDRVEDEQYFDYFFAVRFRLIDFMKIREFLYFQYNKNFKNELNKYEIFLHDMLLKYDNLFSDGKRGIIAAKVIDEIKKGSVDIPIKEVEETDDAVLAVKVMAIHYLLKVIEPDMKRKDSAKARFIKMLTGNNGDNIYKMVQSPLSSRTGNNRKDEMEIVRKYFSDLGLNKVIEIMSQDYKS